MIEKIMQEEKKGKENKRTILLGRKVRGTGEKRGRERKIRKERWEG